MSTWKSPYDNLPKDRRFHLSVDVDIEDHRLLKATTVSHGALSLVIQTFYHDLAEYVRANNLTYVDADAFLNYLRQRADSRFAPAISSRDERGAESGVRQDTPSRKNKSSGVRKTVKD